VTQLLIDSLISVYLIALSWKMPIFICDHAHYDT